MSSFWERKAAKARGEEIQSAPVQSSDGPWWRVTPVPSTGQGSASPTPENRSEGREGHDFSKALHLKNEGSCPECGSGNYIQVTKSAAWRCFNCGYVDGRSLADPNRPIGLTSDAPAQRTRQISSITVTDGTGRDMGRSMSATGDRGRISTAAEAEAHL